ncbi:hypothetical protein C8F01DRAFT_582480 [Mycena amicta]|nr:hypothetical protein C8F01DRAFT_582480 [Mycena amicta]
MSSASASGAAAAAQRAAFIQVAKEVFATTFIGFILSTVLYGVSVLQLYLYLRRYKDRWTLQSTVAMLWSLDTAATILQALAIFSFVWPFFEGKPNVAIPVTFSVEKGVVTVITFLAQCFYAFTIWKMSKNKILTLFILLLTFAAFGLGIYTTYHLFADSAFESISSRTVKITTGTVQGLAALDDIAITVAMSYYLHIRRTGLPSTKKLLDTLILYAVSRGVLTAVAQIMFLVLNVALPHHEYWLPFHMVVGKLYVNSVLATLNVRSSLSQTEIQLGQGISFIGRDNISTEQTATKPITFVPTARNFNSGSSQTSSYAEEGIHLQ